MMHRASSCINYMTISNNFSISFDPKQGQIEVHLLGFLTANVVSDFYTAYLEAKSKVLAVNDTYMTLIDLTEMKMQSADIVSDFALILNDPISHADRLAFVVGDSPVVLQLRRIMANPHIFKSRAEARSWLLSPV
jgi:hypothetical protein